MGSEWRPADTGHGGTATLGRPTTTKQSYGSPWQAQNQTQSAETAPARTDSRQDVAQPRWHEPKQQPTAKKVYASSRDVRQVIATAVGSKLAEDFRLFLGDNQYFLPSVSDAMEIVTNSGLSRATYMPESFDCDDFAMVLKAHFCEAAYKNMERRAPHCIGMIWGELPHVHAINWMINDDYRLRLIEPQNGKVFEPSNDHRNITFMMA